MSHMSVITRTVTVNAPVEKVFDYALDVRKLWVMPDVALADVVLKPDGVGTTARIWSHFLGFHLEGGLEYTEVVRPERIIVQVSFLMEHPTWTFTFQPVDGGTSVTAQGEWHVSIPVVGEPYESMMAKEHEPFIDTMLADLKTAVEEEAT
jgi:uncharacterized protein YndB with AHSA1/START domain